MFEYKPEIHLLDSCQRTTNRVQKIAEKLGSDLHLHANCSDALRSLGKSARCIVIFDYLGLGLDGLEFPSRLKEFGSPCLPALLLSRDLTLSISMRYLKQGVVGFYDKSCFDSELQDGIVFAGMLSEQRRKIRERYRQLDVIAGSMSPGENAVVEMIVAGKTNRQIANHLNVTVRTIEASRSKIVKKFEVQNASEVAYRFGELEGLRKSLGVDSF